MSRSILVSESSYLRICNAAAHLDVGDRAAFVAAVFEALDGHEIGEGAIARAVGAAFVAYWNPPRIATLPVARRRAVKAAKPPPYADV